MRMRSHLGLTILLAILAVLVGEAVWVHAQRPAQPAQEKPAAAPKGKTPPEPEIRNGREGKAKDRPDPNSLRSRLTQRSQLPAKEVDRFLEVLGPVIMDMLQAGQQADIKGLGSFRVVRVPAHRDLVDGRPATIPAQSYVEFVPEGTVNAQVTDTAAEPTEVVPPFQYNPLPNQTPSLKTGSTRAPRTRTR